MFQQSTCNVYFSVAFLTDQGNKKLRSKNGAYKTVEYFWAKYF